jgi:hypothetical protein
MTMRQALVFIASVAFLLLWTLGWGLLATGSLRGAVRYFLDWARAIGLTLLAGGVVFLIAWPLLSPG